MSTDDARTRLLEASGPIFAEKGFRDATVRDICQQAGVNIASINYHFGDKERLYIETVKRAHQLRIQQVQMPEWPVGTPATVKLRDFVQAMMSRMIAVDAAPWQAQLVMRETLNPTTACRELVQESFRPQWETLVGILDEILPEQTPPYRRHQIANSVVGQCLHYHVAGRVMELLLPEEDLRLHFSARELANHVTDLTLAALGLREPIVAEIDSSAMNPGDGERGYGSIHSAAEYQTRLTRDGSE